MRHLKRLFLACLVCVALLGLVEGTFYYYLRVTKEVPSGLLLYALRAAYHSNRLFIQYDANCARYDPEVTYTLRPGVCVFSGAEFRHTVSVNLLGLRDDDRSLSRPEVIVLGDSHAMGWGVGDSDTFPHILETEGGWRVLNAAISSFGTAREVAMLGRLDTANLKLVILQYCSNDWVENRFFAEHGALRAMSRQRYDWLVNDIKGSRVYKPGQYLSRMINVHFLRRVGDRLDGGDAIAFPTGPSLKAKDNREEAKAFLAVLRSSGSILRQTPIILIEINAYGNYDNGFMEGISEALRNGYAAEMRLNIKPVDLRSVLETNHFYKIDDHLNKAGHRAVADELLKRISAMRISQPKHKLASARFFPWR